jgi:hypothetical protein
MSVMPGAGGLGLKFNKEIKAPEPEVSSKGSSAASGKNENQLANDMQKFAPFGDKEIQPT